MTEISEYLNDPAVTEVVINRFDQLWVEENGQLASRTSPWKSDLEYRQFLRSILDLLNADLSLQEPFCSGRVGNVRIQVAGPPATQVPGLSFRKIQPTALSLERWVETGGMSAETSALLKRLIKEKKNILVYGATGSGKTTLLSSLLSQTENHERIILLEDLEELALPNGASLRLLSRFDTQGVLKTISLSDLVKHSLRLRPDRLALGEVRGPEAKDLLLALATGHQGSLGTLHANSFSEALLRLEMLVQLGAPQWQQKAIRQLILLSINTLVGVKKGLDGKRIVSEIRNITGLEEFGFLTESAF
jgi:pilus assembly protein CpaF